MKKKNSKRKIIKNKIETESKLEIKISKLKKVLKNLIISFIAFVVFSIGYQIYPVIILFTLALIAGVISLSFFMILLIIFFLKIFKRQIF